MNNTRYKYIKDLGRGGSGSTKLVFDRHLTVKKVIKEVTLCSPDQIEAFMRETNTLKTIKHPGIPVITDQWVDRNTGFFVMDYCDGITLDAYVKNSKRLPVEKSVSILCDLVELILVLHNSHPRIIHGDLKPENLIVSKSGLHLLDFGTAYFENDSTKKPALALTYGYASPSLLEGNSCTIESDIYAVGMILFFLLTGKDVRNYPNKCVGIEDFPLEYDSKLKDIFCKCISGYHHSIELLDDIHNYQSYLHNHQKISDIYPIKNESFYKLLHLPAIKFKNLHSKMKYRRTDYIRLEHTLLSDGGHLLFAFLIGLAIGILFRMKLQVYGYQGDLTNNSPLPISLQTQEGDNILVKANGKYEDYNFPKIRISDRRLKETGEYFIVVSVDSPEGKHLSQSFSYNKLSK